VTLREPEASQRATFLELFFDLALVFALFQVSRILVQHLHWSDALRALVLLVALWRIWFITTWVTDRLDQQWWALQLLVIITLFGTVVLAAALPQAFGKYGLIFAGVNVAIRMGQYFFLTLALRGHELRRIALGSLVWSGISAPPWVAGALTHGTARAALWALAAAVDYASLTLNFRIPRAGRAATWEPPVAAEHLAERYRQVFIVALGELILVSGLALSDSGFVHDVPAAFVVSMATTALLWRIYIHLAGNVLSAAFAVGRVSNRISRWAGHVHLAMIAGIVVTAAGDGLVIAHPSAGTALASVVVILGGPALFLAARGGLEYTVFARVSWTRPIGVLVLAALTPVTLHVPPLLAATAAMAVLAGVAIVDAARTRRHPELLPPRAGRPS
jgi:low temperature requirement protein LtrA